MSTEEIIGKYAGENAREIINLQRIIGDYIMLMIRIKKNEIKAASGQVMSPSPTKLTCEMHDIMLFNRVNKGTSRVGCSCTI